jgi:hypothetical protein
MKKKIQIANILEIDDILKKINYKLINLPFTYWGRRYGSRIGTVELQHPLWPLDIIDNM